MTPLRAWTTGIILATVVVLVGWDVFAVAEGGYSATISSVVLASASTHPVIAFAAGVLCGHLFWPQPPGGREAP